MPMLHHTISQSSNCDCQYSAEAISVPGMVAGSGDATAIKPEYPIRLKSGVAIALPPFPNNPPRNPMTMPTANAPRCSNFPPFGNRKQPSKVLPDEDWKVQQGPARKLKYSGRFNRYYIHGNAHPMPLAADPDSSGKPRIIVIHSPGQRDRGVARQEDIRRIEFHPARRGRPPSGSASANEFKSELISDLNFQNRTPNSQLFRSVFIRLRSPNGRYCAAKTSSALPGVPAPNTYPEPTKSMPPATVGPGAAIEPPLAGTWFTVS